MSKDWDTLLIFDGCRYDLFEKTCTLPGELSTIRSRGSATPEWLRGNFHGNTFHDTVYVTGNPMLHRHRGSVNAEFHEIINVWAGEGWSEEEGTVPPEPITKAAIEAHNRYPNKRILVHYMQPHYPFIGSKLEGSKVSRTNDPDEPPFWMKVMTGQLSYPRDEIWEAYHGNLELVMSHSKETLSKAIGKVVISSDHGNMLGERASPIPIREWGHPPGIYTSELVEVPWFECPVNGSRRHIISEPPNETSQNGISVDVNERLSDLGYK